MDILKLKQIIEAALMASGEVLSIERLQLLFDDYDKPKSTDIKKALDSLMEDFSDRGTELVEIASGYRLQVKKDVAPWVTRLWDEKPPRYSRALLETLSLIAYRQPITRGDIEDVRGVAVSSHIIRTLLDREWVRVVGHRDVPGRPAMYATTKAFLDYFSLKSLEELPTLDEIRQIDAESQNVDLINAEKDASVTRDYDFASEEDVMARGEEVLDETQEELEKAERLVQQVEDNVFNQTAEIELEDLDSVESGETTAFTTMANKAEQALKNDHAPSVIELADKIADHQVRLSGNKSSENDAADNKEPESEEVRSEESLTLLQQQEQLMTRLMEEEASRHSLNTTEPDDSDDSDGSDGSDEDVSNTEIKKDSLFDD